jgi:hypothetical protein
VCVTCSSHIYAKHPASKAQKMLYMFTQPWFSFLTVGRYIYFRRHSRWSEVTTILVCACAQQNDVLQDLYSCIGLQSTKPSTQVICSSWFWMCTMRSFLKCGELNFLQVFLVTNLNFQLFTCASLNS